MFIRSHPYRPLIIDSDRFQVQPNLDNVTIFRAVIYMLGFKWPFSYPDKLMAINSYLKLSPELFRLWMSCLLLKSEYDPCSLFFIHIYVRSPVKR